MRISLYESLQTGGCLQHLRVAAVVGGRITEGDSGGSSATRPAPAAAVQPRQCLRNRKQMTEGGEPGRLNDRLLLVLSFCSASVFTLEECQ